MQVRLSHDRICGRGARNDQRPDGTTRRLRLDPRPGVPDRRRLQLGLSGNRHGPAHPCGSSGALGEPDLHVNGNDIYLANGAFGEANTYIYSKGDVYFGVGTADKALASELLAALP